MTILCDFGTCSLAARQANEFVTARSRNSLKDDDIPTLGLVKAIEIIGEAAANLDDGIREAMPGVPWERIIGMRHRLVHAYFEIDLDIVWKTATKAAPQLASELETYLSDWSIEE